jgi:hypothetical protein
MKKQWHQYVGIKAAIIIAVGGIIVAAMHIWNSRSELKQENRRLSQLSSEQSAEIQRLETLLTPFRTIALERYTGTEDEVLQQLAKRIKTIDASLADAKKTIENLKQELIFKTSDRQLTQEKRQTLIQSLLGVTGKVIIKADFADSEANMYANQIKDALDETNLELVNQPSTGIVSVHEKGICLLVMDVDNLPPHAEAVLKAIQRIEPNVIARMSKSARFPQDAVLIWICHK